MLDVTEWNCDHVIEWAKYEKLSDIIINCIKCEDIDGKCILSLNESDIRGISDKCDKCKLKLGDVKRFWIPVRNLQKDNHACLVYLGLLNNADINFSEIERISERISPPLSVDGRATSIPPELFKTMISLGFNIERLTTICAKNLHCATDNGERIFS